MRSRSFSRERAPAAFGFALALSALAGCGQTEVKAPNPTRALDERRAIEVIRRAIAEEGVQPAEAREVKLASGKPIRVDVGVAGREFGLVYVSTDDLAKLGDAIPPPNKKDERLRLVRAGDDGETRLVLLYQDNYLYDDLVGESHEQTTITCERQLSRDARDFVTYAKAQKYK